MPANSPSKGSSGLQGRPRPPRLGVGSRAGVLRCLETRTRVDGLRHRKYRDEGTGLIYRTVEVPAEVWSSINRQGRARNRLLEHGRRLERDGKRAAGLCLLQEGWGVTAVAHELGVGRRTVQRWKSRGTQQEL